MNNNFFKLSVLGLASTLLTACVVSPVSPSNQTRIAVKAERSCPSCIAELKPTPGNRLIDIKIESNSPDLRIFYRVNPDDINSYRNQTFITRGNFDGVIQVPENETLLILAESIDDDSYVTGATRISPDQKVASVKFKNLSSIEKMSSEFEKLTLKQKRDLMRVVSLYSVTINSPKMLFSSKLAEAEGAANDFYLQMPKSFKETMLRSKLNSIGSQMKFIDMQSDMSTNGVIGVDQVRRDISRLERIFRQSIQ